jgi:pyrroline-5-carboxylate reductase
MANSLIRGLLAKGMDSAGILAADIDEEKLQRLHQQCDITTASNQQIADTADVIVIAVKPQSMEDVCRGLTLDSNQRSPLIVSIAAGITINHLQTWLGDQTAIVRCMPNTPALIGKGASGLFANPTVSEQQRQLAEQLMTAVGLSVWVNTESDIDTVTAVSGSGPAYFFLFMEAMQEVAVEMGLSEDLARALTYQTAAGAAELAISSEDDTAELRLKVTSPGGTTEQAINQFEEGGLRELVCAALNAARNRSIELADEFGEK